MTAPVQESIVRRVARETREGLADISGVAAFYLKNPAVFRGKWAVWKQTRKDAATQARLNRQIRKQFIRAFNASAARKMSVETNDAMRRYKFRNGFLSALLRPYEVFTFWNMPSRIATAAVCFKAARMLLYPAMGLWGVAVPLAGFIGARMASVYTKSENKRQEEALAREGFVVPCDFEVRQGQASVMGRDIAQGAPLGFPVMHTGTPEWVVSTYDSSRKSLTSPRTIHAAAFEALRGGRLSVQDIVQIDAAFPKQPALKNCACAFAVVFPARTTDELTAEVQQLSQTIVAMPAPQGKKQGLSAAFNRAAKPMRDVTVAEASLQALEAFCLQGAETASGLSILAGKATPDDIRYLVHLQSLGITFDAPQAKDAVRMLKDPRFADELSFRRIADVALLPAAQASAFDDLWKDREYRTRFGYDLLREIVRNAEGWGGVALRLARHDYARSLSGEQLAELAQPENEHWAKVYHELRLSQPETMAGVCHDTMKEAVQAHGFLAAARLSAQRQP